jgi:tight adherence protein C
MNGLVAVAPGAAVPLAAFCAAVTAGIAAVSVPEAAGSWRRRRDSNRSVRVSGPRRMVRGGLRNTLTTLQRVAPGLVARAGGRDARTLIARAGLIGVVGARDLASLRLLCLACAVIVSPRLLAALPPRMWPFALSLWLAAGAELPLWWLRRAGARRAEALRDALPDALELMRACLAAGLPLRRTLLLIGDHCADPLAGEFICVATETAFGIPRAVALDGLVARNPLPEMRALVSAIRQAERHGSPLAPVIAAQADDARRAHNRAVIERGARAAPKIQLIVATTIVPAAMLGLAAVAIAAVARGDLKFI